MNEDTKKNKKDNNRIGIFQDIEKKSLLIQKILRGNIARKKS